MIFLLRAYVNLFHKIKFNSTLDHTLARVHTLKHTRTQADQFWLAVFVCVCVIVVIYFFWCLDMCAFCNQIVVNQEIIKYMRTTNKRRIGNHFANVQTHIRKGRNNFADAEIVYLNRLSILLLLLLTLFPFFHSSVRPFVYSTVCTVIKMIMMPIET